MSYKTPSGKWPVSLYPKEFNSFAAAKQRCNGSNRYAVRWYNGITFGFHSFHDFMEALGPKPDPSYELDRIDNSKGYEPGNVRWVSRSDQMENRRSTRLVEWRGVTQSVAKWERHFGCRTNKLRARLNRGWSVERAFTDL